MAGSGKRRRVRGSRVVAVVAAVGAVGALTVTFVSGGGRGSASAEANLNDFVPIERVAANVPTPRTGPNASRGVFTVDCGTNRNGKFSPDNPVAQPGIRNGAEHLHDFVGNLAIDADTPDAVLAASGTTCRNGDRSSYFWPVVRIDKSVRADLDPQALGAVQPTVSCPRVADRLPAVPASARDGVRRDLAALDRQLASANGRMAASRGRIDQRLNQSVLGALRAERAETIKRISRTMSGAGSRPRGLVSLVDCEVSYDGLHATHSAAPATASGASPGVRCPSVRDKLPGVPASALDEVNRNLDLLDQQIAEANERLVTTKGQGGPNFALNAIVGPLQSKRVATLDRIAIAIGRTAPRPQGLEALAACTLDERPVGGQPGGNGDGEGDGNGNGNNGGNNGNGNNGGGDKPLPEPQGPNLELPNNTGRIVQPSKVLIEYRGNPGAKVTPMPRFLRALTGDAKPTSRGPANARATWTCSGFADRLSDRYPICPDGSQVMRVQDFPGCWDGRNTDSENHRAHLAFADPATGACPQGFGAIPQLRISIAYDIPRAVQLRGQYALDSFPEENHNPFSDHNDFVNVNSDKQMRRIAACLNEGRRCS
ncbi:DUF1996 domain-containing protein [Micromonospora carbonacea]|uniref:DUF1996 domain-containing protein n=1 Tax=Micromonospora carbonacea TaxID=47853 RepID=A0A1C5A5R0_9ACTN|nr:DUF1996 domain-containing protein [Micromonospora carbonacea]SCF40548.1 protein of unknown function (DUF1996) [Micromonospora carbonacea]